MERTSVLEVKQKGESRTVNKHISYGTMGTNIIIIIDKGMHIYWKHYSVITRIYCYILYRKRMSIFFTLFNKTVDTGPSRQQVAYLAVYE